MPTKSTGGFVILAPDVVAPIQSVTATSVMGWGGFLFSLIACGVLVWKEITGRGKSLAVVDGKLDKLCGQVDDLEGKLSVVDGLAESVRELTQEWRGAPGSDNGYRNVIRENQRRIGEIERRNYGIDAVQKARDEDDRRGGGQHRRAMDDQLSRILPEKREDKP